MYLTIASLVILASEFAPAYYFEKYVAEGCLPWMGMRYGKATLQVICGSFCFDSQSFSAEHVPNEMAGASLILSGLLWTLYYFGKVEASPSDYRGFQHPSTDLALIIRNPYQSGSSHK